VYLRIVESPVLLCCAVMSGLGTNKVGALSFLP
jgi:hypothetical protein